MPDRPRTGFMNLPPKRRWQLWFLVLAAGLGSAGVGAWLGRGRVVEAAANQPASAVVPAAAAPAPPDFVAALGSGVSIARVLSVLDTSARVVGVLMTTVAVSEHPATLSELGRLELTLVFRGPFVATKQILVDVCDRLPTASVRGLKMKALEGDGAGVLTTVVLSVWSGPVARPTAPGGS